MTIDTDITIGHINALMTTMASTMYKATDSEEPGSICHEIMETCHALLALDYNIVEVSNSGGELSTNYPHRLLVPESELPTPNAATTNGNAQGARQTIYEHNIDAVRLREHLQNGRLARCRARFPIPVILYRGRFICRSATLSGCPEMYGRATLESLFGRMEAVLATSKDEGDNFALEMEEDFSEEDNRGVQNEETFKNFIDETRANDIRLLDYLNVGVIVDLMVEKKKVKFGMNVSSSEKVDKEKRYAKFHIAALPYPGCEFFKKYRDNSHNGANLYYEWSLSQNDVVVNAPDIRHHKSFSAFTSSNNTNPKYRPLHICWADYQKWDLLELTMNYMRATLQFIANSNSGTLVHCISGWDRTPLFISLLRMSLWADGAIHQSLNANQLLYYTIAYDWFLFGHNLPDRLYKGEDIFFFCFNVLKLFTDKEFCTVTSKPRSRSGDHGFMADIHGAAFEDCFFNVGSNTSDESNQSMHSNGDSNDGISTGNVSRNRRDRTSSDRSDRSNGSDDADGFVDVENANGATNSGSVPIPRGAAATRQRNESTSSIGSWQMVTGTGSFRDQFSPPNMPEEKAPASVADQYGTVEEEAMSAVLLQRRNRLFGLRMVFYKCYWATVGRSKANGAIGNLRP